MLGKFGHGALSRFKKQIVAQGLTPQEVDQIIPSHIRAASGADDEAAPVPPVTPDHAGDGKNK